MNARAIDSPSHNTIEGIDLTNQMPLAEPPNRRIAGHLPDPVTAQGNQRNASAHPRSGCGSLGAGMPTANDDDIIASFTHIRTPLFHVKHYFPIQNRLNTTSRT